MDKMKILVVDDESRMRKLVSDFLTRKGYAVIEAADGVEAVDTFMENKDIALIILDVMMPRMDGWEVCREIRKTQKYRSSCSLPEEMNVMNFLVLILV